MAVLLLSFLSVTCSRCPYLYFGSAIMLVTYFVNFSLLNYHLFGKELFIRFTASAFRKLLSIYVFSYFPFGFEGRMWNLIVSVPDHCLSFYFSFDSLFSPILLYGSEIWGLQGFDSIDKIHIKFCKILLAVCQQIALLLFDGYIILTL